jgi:hypothetical protein
MSSTQKDTQTKRIINPIQNLELIGKNAEKFKDTEFDDLAERFQKLSINSPRKKSKKKKENMAHLFFTSERKLTTQQILSPPTETVDTLKENTKLIPSSVLLKKFKKKIVKKKMKKIAVVSLDYDGCCDLLLSKRQERVIKACFPKKPEIYKKSKQIIVDKLKKIDSANDEIIVVVGSARQDISSDKHNRDLRNREYYYYPHLMMKGDEGLALKEFEVFVKEMNSGKGPFKPTAKWRLSKLLHGDYGRQEGSAWEKEWCEKPYDASELKLDLVTYQLTRFRQSLGDEKFTYHFIDDRKDILTALEEMCKNSPVIPKDVGVYLHMYDWYNYMTNEKRYCEVFARFPMEKEPEPQIKIVKETVLENGAVKAIVKVDKIPVDFSKFFGKNIQISNGKAIKMSDITALFV